MKRKVSCSLGNLKIAPRRFAGPAAVLCSRQPTGLRRPGAPPRRTAGPPASPSREAARPSRSSQRALGCLRHDFSHAPTRPCPPHRAAPLRRAPGCPTAVRRRCRGRGGSVRRLRAVLRDRRLRIAHHGRCVHPGPRRHAVGLRVHGGLPERFGLAVGVRHRAGLRLAAPLPDPERFGRPQAGPYVRRARAGPGPRARLRQLGRRAEADRRSTGRGQVRREDGAARLRGQLVRQLQGRRQGVRPAADGGDPRSLVPPGQDRHRRQQLRQLRAPAQVQPLGRHLHDARAGRRELVRQGAHRHPRHGQPSLTAEGINAFLRKWAS